MEFIIAFGQAVVMLVIMMVACCVILAILGGIGYLLFGRKYDREMSKRAELRQRYRH